MTWALGESMARIGVLAVVFDCFERLTPGGQAEVCRSFGIGLGLMWRVIEQAQAHGRIEREAQRTDPEHWFCEECGELIDSAEEGCPCLSMGRRREGERGQMQPGALLFILALGASLWMLIGLGVAVAL